MSKESYCPLRRVTRDYRHPLVLSGASHSFAYSFQSKRLTNLDWLLQSRSHAALRLSNNA
jgi:hypothetical protein